MQELKTVTEIIKYDFNIALVVKRDWLAIKAVFTDVLLLVHETNLCSNLFVHFQGSETVSLQGR